MKRKFLQFNMISISLLLLISLNNPVSGLNGTDIWNEGGFILYEADFKILYNHNELDPVEFPNIDISGGDIITKYDGLDEDGKMVFLSSSSVELLTPLALSSLMGENAHSIVNPSTALNDVSEMTYKFSSTEGWKDGYETDFRESLSYTDDFGLHSESLNYKIVGDKMEYSLNINNVEKTVESWNLEIEVELNYNDEGFAIHELYLFQHTMTDGNGVVIQSYFKQEFNIKTIEDTAFVGLFFSEFSMDATKSEGVKLNAGSSDSGFLNLLIPWTTLLALAVLFSFYRKRKL